MGFMDELKKLARPYAEDDDDFEDDFDDDDDFGFGKLFEDDDAFDDEE